MGMTEDQQEEVLAALRREHDAGNELTDGGRLMLQHANRKALDALGFPERERPMGREAMRGMSVLELMIVVAILAVLVVVLGFGCRSMMAGASQKRAAEKEARAWARWMGLELVGLDCADNDSDGDGYVSCSANVRGQGIVPIECRAAYSVGHGCRAPKLHIPGQSIAR